MGKTKILICSSEVGAGKRGASLGPDAIRISAVNLFYNLFDQLPNVEIKTRQINRFSPEYKSAKYIKQITSTHRKIANKVAATINEGYNMVIFSGDHSNAAGFAAGFREAYPDKKLGLIWIDAHGDLHSPYTSPSGNVHGMPVAIMLGLDSQEYKIKRLKPEVIKQWEKIKRVGKSKITPKFEPKDITFVSIRDLEEQEWNIINELEIPHYTPAKIKEVGIRKMLDEIEEYYATYDYVYVSFDADSLDPSISVGTGTPVPDGLSIEDAKKIIKRFTAMPNCKIFEVTEVNPLLDTENRMATAIVKILRDSLVIDRE